MKKLCLLSAVMVALAGCGAGPLSQNKPIAQIGNAAVGTLVALSGNAPTTQAASAPLTRAAIEAAPGDLLRVSLISFETTDVISQFGTKGTQTTWISADGASITLDRGLLIATRGVGDDLMGAEVSGAAASLLRGGGTHTRTLSFLTGLDQIETVTFQCQTVSTGTDAITIFERTYATTVLEETCQNGSQRFKNTYWRDGSGVVWQARQWISAQSGYLGYQRL